MIGDYFMAGYQIGRQSSVIWKSEAEVRKPIAYLYNGVRLPALPEWDREAYPYAMICEWDGGYRLFIGESAFVTYPDGFFAFAGDYTSYDKRNDSTEWVQGSHGAYFQTLVWANHDIYDDDGALQLTKSVPIPVYV